MSERRAFWNALVALPTNSDCSDSSNPLALETKWRPTKNQKRQMSLKSKQPKRTKHLPRYIQAHRARQSITTAFEHTRTASSSLLIPSESTTALPACSLIGSIASAFKKHLEALAASPATSLRTRPFECIKKNDKQLYNKRK